MAERRHPRDFCAVLKMRTAASPWREYLISGRPRASITVKCASSAASAAAAAALRARSFCSRTRFRISRFLRRASSFAARTAAASASAAAGVGGGRSGGRSARHARQSTTESGRTTESRAAPLGSGFRARRRRIRVRVRSRVRVRRLGHSFLFQIPQGVLRSHAGAGSSESGRSVDPALAFYFCSPPAVTVPTQEPCEFRSPARTPPRSSRRVRLRDTRTPRDRNLCARLRGNDLGKGSRNMYIAAMANVTSFEKKELQALNVSTRSARGPCAARPASSLLELGTRASPSIASSATRARRDRDRAKCDSDAVGSRADQVYGAREDGGQPEHHHAARVPRSAVVRRHPGERPGDPGSSVHHV